MLRADNIICGISTTGTGALTLAACPQPPGGVDPFTWLTASGMGFSGSQPIPISYTLIEYTSSSFTNVKQYEKGVGQIVLGASLTASSLRRVNVQETATGMNTSTPTFNATSNLITAWTYTSGTGVFSATLTNASPYNVNDWVNLTGIIGANITIAGACQIASSSGSTITIQFPAFLSGGATSGSGGALLVPLINIGTAANTLLFVGASAVDLFGSAPYFEYGQGNSEGLGLPAVQPTSQAAGPLSITLTSGTEFYNPFFWSVPMLVKRATVQIHSGSNYTGGTSDVYLRLYAFNEQGLPGKLLYDFGKAGTPGSALTPTGNTNISTGASGNGFMLNPGEYILDVCPIFSGGTGTPALNGWSAVSNSSPGIVSSGRFGTRSNGNGVHIPLPMGAASSASGGAAPDPANITSWNTAGISGLPGPISFLLSPT